MKKGWLLLGGGLAAMIYAGYKGATQQETLKFFSYSISGIKVKLTNLLSPQIIFAVKVFNPNRTAIPITDFFGNINTNNGTRLATFTNTEAVNLTGQTESTINISARVSALTIIAQLITGGKISSVVVDGIIKTPVFQMPVQKTVTLSSLSGTEEIARVSWQERRFKSKACKCPGFLAPATADVMPSVHPSTVN